MTPPAAAEASRHRTTAPRFNQGDRLRKARQAAGLDQETLAHMLSVSRGTVSNYERSRTAHRRLIVIRAWAMATGVPVRWLTEADYVEQTTDPALRDKARGTEPPV